MKTHRNHTHTKTSGQLPVVSPTHAKQREQLLNRKLSSLLGALSETPNASIRKTGAQDHAGYLEIGSFRCWQVCSATDSPVPRILAEDRVSHLPFIDLHLKDALLDCPVHCQFDH